MSAPTTIDSLLRAVARTDDVTPPVTIGVGAVLGETYELRARLATGGMATVYRAHDRRLGREVAVKLPRVEGLGDDARTQVLRMFEREAHATAQLNHPGIVTLHHVGDHDGTPFLVLELLVGETLGARLSRRGALPVAEALEILDGVLAALSYAHDRGLVHRDLTPRNVFITADQRVKVLDFGVAIEHEGAPGTVTRAAGTPGYMSPEHESGADARSDLWAAGMLFLECVTGRGPAAADEPAIPDALPDAVRDVIRRAVDRDPARRPTTASDMRAELATELVPARPRPRTRRSVIAALIAAGALAALAAAYVELGRGSPSLPMPRDGRWRSDPPGGTSWEGRLRRIDRDHFAYEYLDEITGRDVTGTLTLERIGDGSSILSGKVADVHNCPTCTKVGFLEFIVLDDTHLYQNRALFGPSHDDYDQSFPPYRYTWEGPIASRAEAP